MIRSADRSPLRRTGGVHGGAGLSRDWLQRLAHNARLARVAIAASIALFAAACSGIPGADYFSFGSPPPPAQPTAVGAGRVKVALILPLSAPGNAGATAQSMRNAAEMALAEFNNPDIQLLVKDDGGTGAGAQQAAEQALAEGAEIILGPLFAQSVSAAGQVARARGVPVIAFSTDAGVAAPGVYLLSFLPESEVDRVIGYSLSHGKRSFAALIPDNAYGTVVQAAFQQAVARGGGRVVAMERYPLDRAQIQGPAARVAQAARQVDAIFIPDSADSVSAAVQALATGGVNMRRLQLVGTGLWDGDPRINSDPGIQSGWFAAPDPAGFRAFSARYRTRYGQDPVRPATLAYDAVSLVAALVKTQGPARFSEETLTNQSGFAGIDGVFRFRPDGTNQRGLAVMRVTPSGGQVISPAPKAFSASGT
jgi:ABC-type branched-subunit amino acid transport system substrate-binding protein